LLASYTRYAYRLFNAQLAHTHSHCKLYSDYIAVTSHAVLVTLEIGIDYPTPLLLHRRSRGKVGYSLWRGFETSM